MKTQNQFSASFFFVVMFGFLVFSGCTKKETILVKGEVLDVEEKKAITGVAVVYIWDKASKRPQKKVLDIIEGKLEGKVQKGSKFVVNIHAKGYGLVSKVFYNSIPQRLYELKQATVIQFNPSTGGRIRDTKNNCRGSLSARGDWTTNPMAEVPLRINSLGQIAGFGMPELLQQAYDYHAKAKPCDNGITVSIPPNALNTSAATVKVAMSSIDLFSPDGMPGDYRFVNGSRAGIMESFGAFSIEVYNEKGSYNLKDDKSSHATVTFPIPRTGKNNPNLPKSIPIMNYNEESGEWENSGVAMLDIEKNEYVATVSHFSAVNLDMEKFETACLRFKDQLGDIVDPDFVTSPPPVAYRVEVTAPGVSGGVPRVSTKDIHAGNMDCSSPDDRQFALTRLPSSTDVSVVFFNATTPQPYGVYVFRTGPTDTSLNNPTAFVCTDLVKCGNFHVFNTNDFATSELFIASCKNTSTGLILVSLAIGPSAAGSFNPADYEIRITRSSGASPDCFASYQLTSPVIVSPATSNVKLYQYQINISSLCGSGTYATEAVELYDKNTPPTLVSSTSYLVSCS